MQVGSPRGPGAGGEAGSGHIPCTGLSLHACSPGMLPTAGVANECDNVSISDYESGAAGQAHIPGFGV